MKALMHTLKKHAGGSSSHRSANSHNAELTQRCAKYQTYTPSQMRKVLSKAQIESLVQRGITTQLELHDILQDPNFGILPAIIKDSKKEYNVCAFHKQTPLAHLNVYLDEDPYGSMGVDPLDATMWNKSFNEAVQRYQEALKTKAANLAATAQDSVTVRY